MTTTAAPEVSRHASNKTPAGMSTTPSAAVSLAYSKQVDAIKAELSPVRPEQVSIDLMYVAQNETGDYFLKGRGTITHTRAFDSSRPSKFTKLKLSGAQLVDSLFEGLGGEAFKVARDSDVWDGLLDAVTAQQPPLAQLREWNDLVAILVCARAGVDVHKYQLPHPHPAPKEEF